MTNSSKLLNRVPEIIEVYVLGKRKKAHTHTYIEASMSAMRSLLSSDAIWVSLRNFTINECVPVFEREARVEYSYLSDFIASE